MADSAQYKTLLACLDKLVLALVPNPVVIWNELASAYLIPPPDGQIEAQQLARYILNIVKVEPARYDDVMKVLSNHYWLRDIVKILHTTYEKHTNELMKTVTGVSGVPINLLSRGGSVETTRRETQYPFRHTSSSLRVSNPIVKLNDLCEDDYENLEAQMSDLTVNVNKDFKKLLNQVFESFKQRVDHNSVILTLTQDDVMIFDDDDDVHKAKDIFEVFVKAVRPHCSYFNYELLQLLVEVHGSPEDKARMEQYLQSFARYCQKMPCAEEICGNGDADVRRVKLKFKIDFDRQRLKPEILRRVKYNIAHHLKIQPCSLYLRSVKEGCVLLEFLLPLFLMKRVFPLSNAQKAALYNEGKIINIHCDDPRFVVSIDVPPPTIAEPLEKKPKVPINVNQMKELVLLEKIGYLCEELGNPGRYFPYMRSKNVLNTTDTQFIKTKPTDREKLEEFVTLISKRRSSHGQHGLDVFVDALKKQRVHAHVARTLLRALNKKKIEAEKTSSGGSVHVTSTAMKNPETGPLWHEPFSLLDNDDGYSTGSLHTGTFLSNVSTASSGLEPHPEIPPSPPPISTQKDNVPLEPDGSVHPTYGLLPSLSPSTSRNLSLELEPFQPPPPPLASVDNIAELETLRIAFEKLKFETKQLEQNYNEAMLTVHTLEGQNVRLRQHLHQLQQQHRPTVLHFHPKAVAQGASLPVYHYSSPASGSLTPPRGADQLTRNSSASPGPEPVGEKDLPPRTSESADNSRSRSASSNTPQDWMQLL